MRRKPGNMEPSEVEPEDVPAAEPDAMHCARRGAERRRLFRFSPFSAARRHGIRAGSLLLMIVLGGMLVVAGTQAVGLMRLQALMRHNASEHADVLIRQVEESVSIQIENLRASALALAYNRQIQSFLSRDSVDPEMLHLHAQVLSLMANTRSNNRIIEEILLMDAQGGTLSLTGGYDLEGARALLQSQSLQAGSPLLSGVLRRADDHWARFALVVPIYDVQPNAPVRSEIGFILLYCRTDVLERLTRGAGGDGTTRYCILDAQGRLLAASDAGGADTGGKQDGYLERSIACAETGWRITARMPSASVTKDIAFLQRMLLWNGLILALMLAGVGVVLQGFVTQPVARIASAIARVGERNLQQRLPLHESGEFGLIVENVNDLLDRTQAMTRKIISVQQTLYETELSRKQAELMALQSQINPHFLYNTLECLRSIGTVYGSREIVDISASLAAIFRYCIKGATFVAVSEEIRIIERYLGIMNHRFAGKFRVDLHIAPEVANARMLKMTLQPLVENAIYHGLERVLEGGILEIAGWREEGALIFTVRDDGKGMGEERLEEIRRVLRRPDVEADHTMHGYPVGLRNIERRIRLHHGDSYGLSIEGAPGRGTRVLVRLPG